MGIWGLCDHHAIRVHTLSCRVQVLPAQGREDVLVRPGAEWPHQVGIGGALCQRVRL